MAGLSKNLETTDSDRLEVVDPDLVWGWEGGHHEHMEGLLETGFLSDATLILGPQQERVPVHRFMLQAGSPVFHKKFQDSTVKELVIEDVDPKMFKMLLKHLYTGISGAEIRVSLPLLKLATDYKVTELAEKCAKILAGDLNNENVIDLFNQASEFGRQDLLDNAADYLCKNAWAIVELKQFVDLHHDRLLEILGRDDLMVKDEIQLFEAVVRWAKVECKRRSLDPSESGNVRKVLDKLIGLIRFPVMNGEEFTLKVALTNILKHEELISILLYFQVSSEKRSLIPPGRFKSSERTYYNVRDANGWEICNKCNRSKHPNISQARGHNKRIYPSYCFC